MLKIKVNGSDKLLFTEFKDITLQHLRKAFELVDKQPKEIKDHLIRGKEIEQKKIYEFAIEWILIFSNLEKKHLLYISLEETPLDLGIIKMYEMTRLFFYYPSDVKDLREMYHKGKKYKIIEPLRTASGTELLFGNTNYKQYKLMTQLSAKVDDKKNANTVDSLIQLLAVLYTDGDDSDEAVSKRISEFEDIRADIAWSGWFFFALLIDKYRNFFQSYSSQTPRAKMLILVEQWRRFTSKISFGKYSKMRLQKSEFLVLDF